MIRSPFKTPERLTNLQSEVTGALERLWRFGTNAVMSEGHEFAPSIEVREEPDQFVVLAELPGVPAGTVDVAITPSSLTLSGEKPRPAIEAGSGDSGGDEAERVLQSELKYGHFTRTIALPTSLQVDAVTATARDGVLEIRLPKATGPKPVHVRVETSVGSGGTRQSQSGTAM